MGSLMYGSTFSAEFDDRVLAHLQIVIGAKFRRGESFHFSWKNDRAVGFGRTTLWLHPTMPMIYSFSGNKAPSINRAWVEELMTSANSVGGMQLLAEPGAADPDAAAN